MLQKSEIGSWVIRAFFILVFSSVGYFAAHTMGLNVFKGMLAGLGLGVAVVIFEWFIGSRPLSFIGAMIFGALLGFVCAGLAFQVWTFVMGTDFSSRYFGTVRVDQSTGKSAEEFTLEERKQLTIIEVPRVPQEKFDSMMRVALIVVFSYLGIAILYRTREQFNFIIPYVEFRREERGLKPVILDTSVIIDGRVADICTTGVLDAPFVVPQFVIQELQSIADSSDKLKRNRGRRGLDVLNKMRQDPALDIQIRTDDRAPGTTTDQKLVLLAKDLNARIMTNDFNLNKVARLEGISVININDLANAVKHVALPGEEIRVKVIRQGEEAGQGVGFLDDGTMVVVEQGRKCIGQYVNVVVTSALTTSAGRMIFAKTRDA